MLTEHNTWRAAGLLAFGGLSLAGCSGPKAPESAPRPNILIAIADDQSFPHAGAYGCRWVSTPAFDTVAARGILFNNAYTPNAKSAPSRACVLTGRYSWQLEDAGNHIGHWPAGKYTTVFEALGSHGYTAGYTGKGWIPGNPGKLADGSRRRLIGTPYQEHRTTPPTSHISAIDYAANFDRFLDEAPAGQPWMFWYGGNEPHRFYEYGSGVAKGGKSPADVDRVPAFWPDNDTVRNDMLDYAYEIEYFDRHLGRMLDALQRRGMLDNTIVIVTADNGMPFPRSKGQEYDFSNHLPLAVMWPAGVKDPGRHENGYVNFVDIVPTLLELAGVDAAQVGMEAPSGRSLADIIRGKPVHDRSQTVLCQERHDYGRPLNQGYPIRSLVRDGYLYLYNFKPDLWPAGHPETGYLNTDGSPTKSFILEMRRQGTDTRYWNLCFGRHPQQELYHIATDRECLVNLAAAPEHAARVEDMKKRLWEVLTQHNDPRVTGDGDVFDRYPFADSTSNDFYERYMGGQIPRYQTGWCYPSDYETAPLD